jgi:hypothetical protein
MKAVLSYIEEKKQTLADAPLFEFLKDKSIPPRERLAFTPCLAHFVMTFADINTLILRQPLSEDPIQKIINLHTHEDGLHWRMFMADLETLGMNEARTLSSTLQFVWSEDTKNIRLAWYSIISMLAEADPVLRMVVLEAIEATGALSIPRARAVGLEFEEATGKELFFWGERHASVETGHVTGTEDVERHLHSIVLSEPVKARAFTLVDRVFEGFSNIMDDVFAYAQKARARSQQLDGAPGAAQETDAARAAKP